MRSWAVVVPVKGGGAKSRLAAPAGVEHAALARAIALDTIEAAVAAPAAGRVIVVTSAGEVAGVARALGAELVADPAGDLAAAVVAGVAAAGLTTPVAVLLGDLPALRPGDLQAALEAAQSRPCAFVPDLAGTGTVLLTALTAADLDPRFGPGSAAAHARTGERLELDLPRLRRDVDTAAHLAAAARLGLGPRTAALLAG